MHPCLILNAGEQIGLIADTNGQSCPCYATHYEFTSFLSTAYISYAYDTQEPDHALPSPRKVLPAEVRYVSRSIQNISKRPCVS